MKKLLVVTLLVIAGLSPARAQEELDLAREAAAEGRKAIAHAEEQVSRAETAVSKAVEELGFAGPLLDAARAESTRDTQEAMDAQSRFDAAKKLRDSALPLGTVNELQQKLEVAEIRLTGLKDAKLRDDAFQAIRDIKAAMELQKALDEANAASQRFLAVAQESGRKLEAAKAALARKEQALKDAESALESAKLKRKNTKVRFNPALVAEIDRAEVDTLRQQVKDLKQVDLRLEEHAESAYKLAELKANKTDVTAALATKADKAELDLKADKTTVTDLDTRLTTAEGKISSLETLVSKLEQGVVLSERQKNGLIDLLDRYDELTDDQKIRLFDSVKKLTDAPPAEAPVWKIARTKKWVYFCRSNAWGWTDNGWLAVEQQ